MKTKLVGSVFLLLLFGISAQIFACSCLPVSSTCLRVNFSDAIFVGKAVGEKTVGVDGFTTFEVKETIAGAKTEKLVVQNRSGYSCDISFTPGETYLIFATGNNKKGFSSYLCAGNLPLAAAGELLGELKRLPKGTGGKILGNLSESLKQRPETFAPMVGVGLTIREVGGKGRSYKAVTDAKGDYELTVPAGEYKVIPPRLPAYAALDLDAKNSITVKDRGCAGKNFSVENDSLVSGRIVDSQGNPVPSIAIDFISTDVTKKPQLGEENGGWSDEAGYFSLDHVPSGEYTLSINYVVPPDEDYPYPPTFYPNAAERSKAQVIKVGFGQKIRGIVFRLPPPLGEKKVSGTIVRPDGTPAVKADVYLEDVESPGSCVNGCNIKTDAAGNFELKGFGNRRYRIRAGAEEQNNGQTIKYAAESEVFSIAENFPRFRLELRKETKQ
jgi:hypothetical protein